MKQNASFKQIKDYIFICVILMISNLEVYLIDQRELGNVNFFKPKGEIF
jgi:hypothetical protein